MTKNILERFKKKNCKRKIKESLKLREKVIKNRLSERL